MVSVDEHPHFKLFRRERKGKKPVFYVRIQKPDGRWLTRSTGQTSKGAAERWTLAYLAEHGPPTTAGRIRFDAWAREFWAEDGRYVRLRRAHGHSLGAYHVRQQHRLTRNYLLPEFAGLHLDEITTGHVETYLLRLYDTGRSPWKRNGEHAKIGARTVNRVRSCLKQIMGEAVRLGYLKRNPVDPVFKFKETPNPRGILSREELWALLFKPDAITEVWGGDRVHYLFTLTGAITGARQGEIRALRGRHVHREFIEINHGWDDVLNQPTDAPKWGHRRVATVPEVVGDLLLEWIGEIGAGTEGWVFPSPTDRAIPLTSYTVLRRFNEALERVAIDPEERKRRNVVFHSLRHSLVTAMRAGAVDSWQAQHAVGHRTDRMFDHYADHVSPDHLGDVRKFQTRLMEPPNQEATE